jgi:hypothetical protein
MAMIVLPGPAVVVIPLGLAILATEFVWAGKVLSQFKQTAKKLAQPFGLGRKPVSPMASPPHTIKPESIDQPLT